ncbi:MAG: hypothetical protein KKH98_13240 [Spirochaetes bacterium]|nr:hypothetical protein [Spirochaetota bacterium]
MVSIILILLICLNMGFPLAAATGSVTNVQQYQIKGEGEDLDDVRKYLEERQAALEKIKNKKEPESSLRRFEVQFLTSGAMVYFSTYIFVKLFAEIYWGASSELPDTHWYFVITNSVGIGTYIAIKDYYDVKRMRAEDPDKFGREEEKLYRFSFLNKRF